MLNNGGPNVRWKLRRGLPHFALSMLDAHTFRSELGHDGVELFTEMVSFEFG